MTTKRHHTLLLPPFLELEAFRRSANRKLWFGMGLLFIVSLGCLALATIALARPLAVVAFDKDGRALLFEDTVTPRIRIEHVRIEHFAATFLERWACLDSGSIKDNVTDALNMMTPRFRRIVLADEDALARRLQFEERNLKSRITASDVKIAPFDPADVDATLYLVVKGRMRFSPKVGGEEPEVLERFFFSKLVVDRVPVSREAVYGLLVDFAETKFFESEDALEVYALQER